MHYFALAMIAWLQRSSALARTGRRVALLGGGGALVSTSRGIGGARAAAAPARATSYYYETVLPLPCGARVPAAVWLPPPAAGADIAAPATYAYRISLGKLLRAFLRLPLPNALAAAFPIAAPPAVGRAAPHETRPAATPAVLLAHGFLGTRFDLSDYGEALAAAGAAVISPDFNECLTGSFDADPGGGSDRSIIAAAGLAHIRDAVGAAGPVGAVGHSAGSFTALGVAGPAVAIAGFPSDPGSDPWLAIASSGDGAVPLAAVEPRLPPGVFRVDASAPPKTWPRRAALILAGDAAPCHVSFLSAAVNGNMQAFLGPLLPLARALGLTVLDFDKYGLRPDAAETAATCVPLATAFLAQHLGLPKPAS